eukprot:jgi/Orpsp1_1/1182450/evm.model.c7180000081319.1
MISIYFILFILIYFSWHIIKCIYESVSIKNMDYGIKININGYVMRVNIVGNKNKVSIVLLPGFGSSSPILEFKALAEVLSDKFKVITIEPFGYGISDLIHEERTLEKIISEIHSCIQQIGLKKYYLMGHSFSGIYSLVYANRYPDHVMGFIGIDSSVPKMDSYSIINFSTQTKIFVILSKLISIIGLKRLALYINRKLVINIDPSYKYSKQEIEIFKSLEINRSYNKTIYNEANYLNDDLNIVHDMLFPKNIPVLNFISSENVKYDCNWESLHQNVISESHFSKVIKLEGTHYLHLDNKEIIVKIVKDWINSIQY